MIYDMMLQETRVGNRLA